MSAAGDLKACARNVTYGLREILTKLLAEPYDKGGGTRAARIEDAGELVQSERWTKQTLGASIRSV